MNAQKHILRMLQQPIRDCSPRHVKRASWITSQTLLAICAAAAAAPAAAPLASLGLALVKQGQLAQHAAAKAVFMRQLMQAAWGQEGRGEGGGGQTCRA